MFLSILHSQRLLVEKMLRKPKYHVFSFLGKVMKAKKKKKFSEIQTLLEQKLTKKLTKTSLF